MSPTSMVTYAVPLAAAFLWLPAGADLCQAQPQDLAGPSTIFVRAQKKPGKPWVDYPTLTLDRLPGFSMDGVDENLSPYGGCGRKKDKGNGFFTVARIGDRWWFVDPDGALYYNKAVVSVNPGKSETSLRAVQSVFGGDGSWANATTSMLRENGFNGTGAWSDRLIMSGATPRLPYTVVWNFMSAYGKERGGTFQLPGHTGYPEECMFVFDPGFESFCDRHAARLAGSKDDPWLLGHFSDNELPFPLDALDRFLRLGPDDPGRRAAEQWLRETRGPLASHGDITPADREAFLGLVADRYFRITSGAMRRSDPNHLLLGARFHGQSLSRRSVFEAAGKHLDVISVNYYNTWTPQKERMQEWVSWSGKPVLITEWYVKGADAGLPNTSGAGWVVPTQHDRGLFYQNFALALLRFKGCVGWQWFRYVDNDPKASGVDPSNSDANKGIVSIELQPYAPLVGKMKDLNVRVYRLIDYFDGQGRQ